MDVELDLLKQRIINLEVMVMRLDSQVIRLETEAKNDRDKFAHILAEIQRNRTGPRKFLGI